MAIQFKHKIISTLPSKKGTSLEGSKPLLDRIRQGQQTTKDIQLLQGLEVTSIYLAIFTDSTWIHVVTPASGLMFQGLRKIFKVSMSK